jgi:peptidoglycan-associated lipoprotein
VKINRILLVCLAAALLVFAGAYGCAKKQVKETGGMETQKPMEQAPPQIAPEKAPAPVEEAKEAPPGPKEQPASTEEGTEVKALKDVFFDFDSYVIRPDDATVLQQDADWIKAHPGVTVTVEGNCDERGTVEYNLALGQRRADAAKSYLVSLGISADKLKTISFGKSKPFDPGHDETAWAKNRRDHFVVQQ